MDISSGEGTNGMEHDRMETDILQPIRSLLLESLR